MLQKRLVSLSYLDLVRDGKESICPYSNSQSSLLPLSMEYLSVLALYLQIPLCFQVRVSTLIKKRAGNSPVPHPKLMLYVIRCAPCALLHQKRKSIQYSNRSGKHCVKTRSAPFFTMGPLGAFILPIKTTDMVSCPATMLGALCILFCPHSDPVWWMLLFPPFYRWEDRSSEMSSGLPSFTQLVVIDLAFILRSV